MFKVKKNDERILYSGNSLDTYLSLKMQLDKNGIPYNEHSRPNENFFYFIYRLFIIGIGSLGISSEHIVHYNIYVKETDYNKAKQLIK